MSQRVSRIPEKEVLKRLLDDLGAVANSADCFAAFNRAMSDVGFSGVMLVLRSDASNWKEDVTETSFSPEWIHHYIERKYPKTDPVRRFCFRSSRPFFWREVVPHFRKKELMIFEEAKTFGIKSGMASSIFSGNTLVGAVILGSDATKLDDPRLKTIVSLASQMFISAHGNVAGDVGDVASEPRLQLTKRELQILEMVAAGLSNAQISQGLYIGSSAVEYHLRNIFLKLGVNSRVSAVVTAMRQSLIGL